MDLLPARGFRVVMSWADGGRAGLPWRICSQLGWWSAFGKPKKGKAKKPGPPVHDNLCAVVDEHGVIRHEFTADRPNKLWLSDITEHWTGEGKLYLCAIKDAYSNRIVGYSIDSRQTSRLAVAALNNAVARPGDVAGCVLHTDRGSQYRSRRFVHAAWSDQRPGGGVRVVDDRAALTVTIDDGHLGGLRVERVVAADHDVTDDRVSITVGGVLRHPVTIEDRLVVVVEQRFQRPCRSRSRCRHVGR